MRQPQLKISSLFEECEADPVRVQHLFTPAGQCRQAGTTSDSNRDSRESTESSNSVHEGKSRVQFRNGQRPRTYKQRGRFNIWSLLNTILLVLFFVTWGLRSSTKNTRIETITLRKSLPEDYWYYWKDDYKNLTLLKD